MSKHTPGPWRWDEEGESGEFWWSIREDKQLDDDPKRLAECYWSRADARLIAAAPELVEALDWLDMMQRRGATENVAECISTDAAYQFRMYGPDGLRQFVWGRARAALKKAGWEP